VIGGLVWWWRKRSARKQDGQTPPSAHDSQVS
jgi:hypothetical protein